MTVQQVMIIIVFIFLNRQWDEVKSIFIKELTDSGELTQQKLDEAQK